MTLWDFISRSFASTGAFVLAWWPPFALAAVMAALVGLAINGHRRMQVDPSVPFTPEETAPLSEEEQSKLIWWRTHPDAAYARGEVIAQYQADLSPSEEEQP